jgi:hypothetical protein
MASEQECRAEVFRALVQFRRRFDTNVAMATRLGISTGTVTKWMCDKNEYRGERTVLRSGTLRKLAQRGDDKLRKAANALLRLRAVGPAPTPLPQSVRWGPSDGLPAGIKMSEEGRSGETFVPWSELKEELTSRLLPQLFASPEGFSFITAEHHGKRDWLMYLIDGTGERVAFVWFGVNPMEGWKWDGLVRLGHLERLEVWQVYQRYSDASYRRLQSMYRTLEQAIALNHNHPRHSFPKQRELPAPRARRERKKETAMR